MSQLYLPAAHTDADLILAGQVAERIGSAELHVVWTADHGAARPEIFAELRGPTPLWHDAFASVFRAVRELWSALAQRDEPRRIGPVAGPVSDSKRAAGETAA